MQRLTSLLQRHKSPHTRLVSTLKHIGLGFLLVLVFVPLISYTRAGTSTRVYAATSSTLNFQARLLGANGAIAADGNYSVEFRLYTVASGGTAEWIEAQTVTVKAGYLSVQLGSTTAFPGTIDWSQEHWLTMNVNSDGEMNPRIKLTAVPYAFAAKQAEGLLNGSTTITAAGLAQLGPNVLQNVSSTVAGLRINQTGTGGLVQFQANGVDIFTVSNTGDAFFKGSLNIDGASLDIGSGTQAGSLSLQDGAGKTGTFQLVGPLSTNQTYTLPDASGTVCLTTTCAGAANGFVNGGNLFGTTAVLGTNDNNDLSIRTNSQARLTILKGGNVGIGEANPSALLSVGAGSAFQVNNSGAISANGLSNNNAGITNTGSLSGVGANITATAGLTISSTGVNDLTLASGSGLINVNAATLKSTAGLTMDLSSAVNLTFALNNSGAGTADLNLVDGGLQVGGMLVLSNARALSSLTGLASSGTVTFSSLSTGGLVKTDTSGNLLSAIAGTDYENPLTFGNGLTRTGNTVALGGTLGAATNLALNSNALTISGSGSNVITALAAGGLEIKADTTAALAIKGTGGTSFFTVNTTGNLVQIGSATTDATAILSVLDSYNGATDPTGINGASYYSTTTNSNRCYENGYWSDCAATRVQSDATLAAAAGSINVAIVGTETNLTCHLSIAGRSAASLVYLRFNNVSAAGSYSYNVLQNLTGANNNTSSQASGSATQIPLNGTSSGTNPGMYTVNINNYATANKSVDWTGVGSDAAGSVPNNFKGGGTYFNNTAQITSVQFLTSTGTFNAGTRAWCDGR